MMAAMIAIAAPSAVGQSVGSVFAWGDNYYGELGNGVAPYSSTPVQVNSLSGVQAVASGRWHVLALKDGTVWAWGYNGGGQLGNGTTTESGTPAQVLGPGGSGYLTGVVAISAGSSHSLAVKSDGTVWAWGSNYYGELGDGTINDSSTPVQVYGLSGITAVAAGYDHSLALKSDGTVWAWGYGSYGQLGNDAYVYQQTTPVQASGLSGVTLIAAGDNHSLARESDGSLWTWGDNEYGQLGNAATGYDSFTPLQVTSLSGVQAIAAGGNHTLAVTSGGAVWAWGYNGYGQLGDGTNTDSSTPVQVSGLSGVVAAAGGYWHSLAVKGDGATFAWGDNSRGQLGDGSAVASNTPVQVDSPVGLAGVAGGYFHSVALASDGTVWAWGDGWDGQLGNGAVLGYSDTPVAVIDLSGVMAIAAGDEFSLALKSDGTVWAWGYNWDGELGNGTTTDTAIYAPAPVIDLSGVIAIATGDYHSLALRNDGTVWAWGANWYGQLGNDTTDDSSTPVQVSSLSGVIAIAAGGDHSLAVKSDGTVWAWGYNGDGELGDGTSTDSSTPVPVSGLSEIIITAVAAGYDHSLALTADGAVWAWGYNGDGELGDGTYTGSNVPVQVISLPAVVTIAAGDYHSLALTATGAVWAWGYNADGELGDGTYNSSGTPLQVAGLSGIVGIEGGGYHTLALTGGGTVWAWGYNGDGELGDGTTIDSGTPVQVSGLTQVSAVAAGYDHSLALSNAAAPATGADLVLSPITGANYGVIVSNNGPFSASNVVLTDTLERFTYVSYTLQPASQGACSFAAGVLTCDLGTIGKNGYATVTVIATPPNSGWASHLYHASASEPDPNPTNNSVRVGTGLTAFNTQLGSNIAVLTGDGSNVVAVVFAAVTREGTTSLSTIAPPAPVPAGFRSTPAMFFDVSTTAGFTGVVSLSFHFPPSMFRHPAQLRLFHLEGGAWVDRTSAVDPVSGTISGVTSSLSPFALLEPVDRVPVADAGADLVCPGASPAGATVLLDGAASSDADADPLTYRWTGPFSEGGGAIAGAHPQVTLPLGVSRVSLVVNDGEADSAPVTIAVTVSDFDLVLPQNSATVKRGEPAAFAVTITPKFGRFDASITLACAGLPAGATCSFSSATVTPGAQPAFTAVTISTAGVAALAPARPHRATYAVWIGALGLIFGTLLADGSRKRRMGLMLALGLLLVVAQFACGGGGGGASLSSEPATVASTTVTITISGASGSLTHAGLASLTLY
jgi:alpha-tubulin suppressor-like RCC1 family protein